MKISIDPVFSERDVTVSLGVVQTDVFVEPSSDELRAALQDCADVRIAELDGKPASTVPQIMETRKAYKALGKDPARYRPAAEALTRRLLQGKGLYHVNNVVEVNNLISIKSGISIGTYICDAIEGDVTFRRAGEGESYKGIGRGYLNLEGLPVFSDDLGPFGCPTSDSERTMIREGNQHVIMILICFGEEGALAASAQMAQDLLKVHCSAKNITVSFL